MRVLIADDHALFREGLVLQLKKFSESIDAVQAATFSEALEIVDRGGELDLVLLDLSMPDLAWREGLKALLAKRPGVPVVILSATEDPQTVKDSMEIGASGFIPKTTDTNIMKSALKLVLEGGSYLPPQVLPEAEQAGLAGAGPKAALASRTCNITPRQLDVLTLLGQGKSNKEIANELGLTEGTVKLHVTSILRALKVQNRTQALIEAQRLGVFDGIDKRGPSPSSTGG